MICPMSITRKLFILQEEAQLQSVYRKTGVSDALGSKIETNKHDEYINSIYNILYTFSDGTPKGRGSKMSCPSLGQQIFSQSLEGFAGNLPRSNHSSSPSSRSRESPF